MNSEAVVGLIHNTALLLGLAVIYDNLPQRKSANPHLMQLVTGLMLGLIGLAVMFTPWQFSPGILFDTRSILLSLTGLFFGTIPTLVAVVMTAVLRLFQGGAGAWTGVAVIVSSGVLGLVWRRYRFRGQHLLKWTELYLFGIVVHLTMLLWMLTLPGSIEFAVLRTISIPVMGIYPIGTVLLGLLLVRQQKRTESEARYKAVVEQSITGIYIVQDNQFLFANDRLCEILGYTVEELYTQVGLYDLVVPEDQNKVAENIRQRLEKETDKIHYTVRALRKNGTQIWVEIHGTLMEVDGEPAITGMLLDITERVNADQAKIESEDRFSKIFEASSTAISLYQLADYRIIEANGSFLALTGYEYDEVIGKSSEELNLTIDDEDRDRLREIFQEHNRIHNVEYSIRTKSGEIIDTLLSSEIVHINNVPYGLSLLNNITVLKQTEAALKLHKERLEHAEKIAIFGSWEFVAESKTGWWSNQFYEMMGFNPADGFPSNEVYLEAIHPEDRMIIQNVFAQMARGEELPPAQEYRSNPANGPMRYFNPTLQIERDAEGKPVKYTGTVQDITRRKQVESERERAYVLFEKIFQVSPITTIFSKIPESIVLEVNPAFENVFGYTRDKLIGKPSINLDLWAYPEARQEVIKLMQKDGRVRDYEFTYKTKDGKLGQGLYYAEVIDHQDEKYALTKMIDITKAKQAEASLREREHFVSAIVDTSPAIIYVFDMETQSNVYINSGIERLLGYRSEEIQAMGSELFARVVHPDDLAAVIAFQEEIAVAADEAVLEIEYRMQHRDGSWRVLHSYERPFLRNSDGSLKQKMGIATDVTESKLAEDALRHSEELFANAFQVGPTALTITRIADGKFIDVNDSFLDLLGFNREEVIGHTSTELKIWTPEEREKMIQKQLETGGLRNAELIAQTKSGQPVHLLFSTRPMEIGGEACHITTLIDISERKLAEQKVKLSEERLRLAIETAEVAVWEYDFVTNQMARSDNHDQLYGLEHQAVWVIDTFLNATHPDDRELSNELIQAAVAPGGPDTYEFDFRVIWPDESVHWLNVTGEIVQRDEKGQGLAVRGCLIDITERKQTEERIVRLNDRITLAARAAGLGIWDWDIVNNQLVWDKEMYALYGTDERDFSGAYDAWVNGLHPDDIARSEDETQRALRGEMEYDTQFRVVWPDGTTRHLQANATVYRDMDGNPVRMVGVNYDITEAVQAEQALRNSEERFSKIFHASPFPINLFRLTDGRSVDANDAHISLTGYSREEFINKTAAELNLFTDPNVRNTWMNEIKEFGKAGQHEIQFRQKSGQLREVMGTIELIDVGGEKFGLAMAVDITDRNRAVQELRRSEERFSKIFHASPFPINLFRMTDGRSVDVNDAYLSLTGYSRAEFIDRTAAELNIFVDPNARNTWMNEIKEFGKASQHEIQIRQKSGAVRDVVGTIEPIDVGGEKFGLAMAADITDRKQAEEERDEARQLFQKVFELNPVATTLSSLSERKIVNVNEALEKLLGYTSAELIGKPTTTIDYWVNGEERQQAFEILRKHGSIKDYEFSFKTKTGKMGRGVTSAEAFEEDGEKYILTTLFDITARVQAEEERQKFVMLADSSSEFIGMCNLDLEPLYVNPAGVRMVGLPDMAAACQVKVQDYFFPEDQQFIAEEFFPRVLQEGHGDVEIRLRHFQTGEPIWMFYTLFHLRDASGAVIGWATVSRDITERKRAEIEIKESEERFRTAFEHSASGMCLTGLDGSLLKVNQPLCKMLGYTMAELEGQHFNEITHPDDIQIGNGVIRKMIAGEVDSVAFEKRYLHKTGTPIWVHINSTLFKDAAGKAQYFITQMEDVTNRKQAQEALQRYNHRLAALRQIDQEILKSQSPEVIIAATLERIRSLIPCWRASVGLFDKDVTEAVIFAVSSEEPTIFGSGTRVSLVGSLQIEELKMGKTLVLSDLQSMKTSISQAGQQYVKAGIRSAVTVPIMVDETLVGSMSLLDKQPDFFSAEHQEIIEEVANQLAIALHQHRLKDEIQAQNEALEDRVHQRTAELEAVNKELETFTYSVSHDLKAPLRGIDGYSQLLLEDYMDRLDEDGRLFLQKVRQAADQMHQLIEDLLAYSRLERRSLQLRDINIPNLVDSLVNEHATNLDYQNTVVDIDIPFQIISTDEDGLSIALRNLLENAFKFTRDLPAPLIKVGGQETENSCILWVQDNGIGFDMTHSDRIFEIFQRLHRSEVYPGTGIGLALVRKAMDRMGGKVWAESEPGNGAKFYLEIAKKL